MNEKIRNNPRIILNEVKWDKKYDINKLTITYLHRGAINNSKIIKGKNIKSLDKSFILTDKSMIPYHRIINIQYEKKIIFKR